jgi:hypothetical protein
MKNLTSKSLRFIPAALGLAACLLASSATAASTYFLPSGGVANAGSYTWDQSTTVDWSTASTGTPTETWATAAANSAFARFNAGSGKTYTVTVNGDISVAGFWGYGTLTLNAAAGSGNDLNMQSGMQGILLSGAATVNAPIVGVGGIEPQYLASGAAISLYGNNTYSGGTYLYSSSVLVYINNNNSFGSGNIQLGSGAMTSFNPVLATGGSTITLANNFVHYATDTADAINFGSSPSTPVISSGTWSMGAVPVGIRNNGGSTSPLTLSGAISGSSTIVFSSNTGSSQIIASGANPFTGTIAVTGPGGTSAGAGTAAVKLTLGAQNTFANASQVIMDGGVLDPGGFHHTMTSATLSLTANSTIDYTSGGAEIDFADSSTTLWTAGKTLNLVSTGGGNWNTSGDALNFNEAPLGLDGVRLSQIEFNGTDLGDAAIDDNGFIYDSVQPIPEPSTVVLSLLGGLSVMWTVRRRTA